MSKGDALVASILESAPRTKLLEACRALGLSGASRLRKGEIASRLLRALPGKLEDESGAGVTEAAAREGAGEGVGRDRSREESRAAKPARIERAAPPEAAPAPSQPPFIPWSYGTDRVRAAAVDPERLFAYWEVTDEGRERANAKLGAASAEPRLVLRVYDTTGRLFDGTNAHGYFDHPVEGGERQKFFDVDRPGSEAFVEIGLRTREGRFARIARSGKVSFPRRSPAPDREPRWLTVPAALETSAAVDRQPSLDDRWRPSSPPVVELAPAARPPSEGPRQHHVSRSLDVAAGPASEEVSMPGSPALLGAGGRRPRGASERRPGGASERFQRGASERRLGPTSGRR
jgi:hypothetical protein